jgi:hypothetical protein
MDSLDFKAAATMVALFLSSANAQSSLGGKGYVDLAV